MNNDISQKLQEFLHKMKDDEEFISLDTEANEFRNRSEIHTTREVYELLDALSKSLIPNRLSNLLDVTIKIYREQSGWWGPGGLVVGLRKLQKALPLLDTNDKWEEYMATFENSCDSKEYDYSQWRRAWD